MGSFTVLLVAVTAPTTALQMPQVPCSVFVFCLFWEWFFFSVEPPNGLLFIFTETFLTCIKTAAFPWPHLAFKLWGGLGGSYHLAFSSRPVTAQPLDT